MPTEEPIKGHGFKNVLVTYRLIEIPRAILRVDQAYFYDGKFSIVNSSVKDEHCEIIAWMHLPEPYEPQESEDKE